MRRLIDFQYVEGSSGFPMGPLHNNSNSMFDATLSQLRTARVMIGDLGVAPDSPLTLISSLLGSVFDELEFRVPPVVVHSGPDEPDEQTLIDPPPPYNELQN